MKWIELNYLMYIAMSLLKKNFLISILLLESIGISASDRTTLIAKGDSCVGQYDYFHALEYYQQARQLYNDSRIQMKIADCYYFRYDFQKCTNLLKEVGEDSLSHDSYREIYYAYGAVKQLPSQVYWGNQLLHRYPMDSKILASLMHVYSSDVISQPQVAVVLGQKYCKKDSEDIEVNRALAEAYFVNQNYQQSLDEYQKLLQQKDTTFSGLYYMGVCYEYLHQLDSARVYLEDAVAKKEDSPVASYRLGIVDTQLHLNWEALLNLAIAAKLYQPDPTLMHLIYKYMGQAEVELNNYAKGIEDWQKAQEYLMDDDLQKRMDEVKKKLPEADSPKG